MDTKNRTITIFTENKPGVLYRISDLFLRRKVNIESLMVSKTEKPGISKFVIIVNTSEVIVERTIKQIHRIIEVTKAY